MNLVSIKKKYKEIPIEIKSAGWFLFCSMFPQVVTVFSTTIFTRMLSTYDYGITSNYSAWYQIVSIFLTFNLNCGVYNNAMLKYEKVRDEYDASMAELSLLLGSFGILAIIVGNNKLPHLMNLPFSLIICMVLQCLLYNPYGCLLSRVKYEYNYIKLVKLTVSISILSFIFSLICILTFSNKGVGKVWGQNVVTMLVGVAIYVKIFKKNITHFNVEMWKYAIKFNLPLIPHYLSLILLNQSDRLIIMSKCGADKNGLYSVAYSAASLILIFNSSMTQAFTPWVYDKLNRKNIDGIKSSVKMLYMALAVIVVGFVLGAPELIGILAGSKYREAIYVLPPIAVGMYFVFVYNVISILEFFYERTKPVMIFSMISAVLNIVLNYIYIPKYGYIAAAYTTLLCYLINALLHYAEAFIICKKMKLKNDLFATRLSFIVGIFLVGFAVFGLSIYEYVLIRWVLLLSIILILFVYGYNKMKNSVRKGI